MKICYISPYPPQKEGIGDYTFKLVEEIKNSFKINPYVITFKKNKNKSSYLKPIFGYSYKDLNKTYKTLLEIKPEIIHIQYGISSFMLSSFSLLKVLSKVKKKIHCKLAITFHGAKGDTDLFFGAGAIFYKYYAKLFDRIYVHTEEGKNILVSKCGIKMSKIKLIPFGTYYFKYKEDLSEDLDKKYCLKNSKIILFFGFIYPIKGIEY
jgi:glycosyltransferase involved in cell wall biosynthesis